MASHQWDEPGLREALARFAHDRRVGRPPRERAARIAWQREMSAHLYDAGLSGPAWPREHGGMGLPLPLQVAYHDEYARQRLPGHPGNGPGIAGPTLVRHGTPEQRDRYLRPMLRGDTIWAQGFSEPEAGSDLASLRTTAVLEGDVYRVTGEKLWSTYADVADILFALVRTGGPGREGISYLLIDLHAPGVTITPIRDLTGSTQFSAVHLADVEVPVANRVGAENGGWLIARTTLGNERAARSLAQASAYARRYRQLLQRLRERDALGDSLTRDRVAALGVRVRLLHLNALRTIERVERDGEAGPGASLVRLELSLLEQALFEVAVSCLGREALVLDDRSIDDGRWARGLLATRGSTIGAGTAQIQRSTIAQQILGLPSDREH